MPDPDCASPVPASHVRLRQGFWAERVVTLSRVTLPHCLERCEATGRLRNFDRAAGRRSDAFEGRYYDDSDVYKVLEGAAHLLAMRPDADADAHVCDWLKRIGAAQGPDGYLHTWHEAHPLERRYADVRWKHELYCVGHLLEAGLALARRRADPSLLFVGLRAVENVDRAFGPGKRHDPPGHPELELALLRLHRQLELPEALPLARFFLEQRGNAAMRKSFGELCQDHQPLREQREAAGHAVRAAYLWAAVADLVAITGDRSWLPALDAVFDDVVERRMYVTGGIGSSAGNEGFTAPYDLPNEAAYAETCAAIGLVLWAQRMGWLHDDARYADVVERSLYNGVLAGLSLSGDRFFYVNPLASRADHARQPWFDCACCPTNLLRFLPQVGSLAYAVHEDVVVVDQYVSSRVRTRSLVLVVDSDLPWAGRAHLRVEKAVGRDAELRLRLPSWCRRPELFLNDRPLAVTPERGYAVLRRRWSPGDTIQLDLPLEIERVHAPPQVAANRGRVALRRGPLVYAAEGIDQVEGLARATLGPDVALDVEHPSERLGKASVIRSDGQPSLTLIPYFAWANRGESEMAVWLAERPADR